MTVLMLAVATLHFGFMNESTFREFVADQEPIDLDWRTDTSSQIRIVATEVINACCHLVLSTVC